GRQQRPELGMLAQRFEPLARVAANFGSLRHAALLETLPQLLLRDAQTAPATVPTRVTDDPGRPIRLRGRIVRGWHPPSPGLAPVGWLKGHLAQVGLGRLGRRRHADANPRVL